MNKMEGGQGQSGVWESGSVEVVILNGVGRVLTEKVTFEKTFQGSKGVNHKNSWWENIPGKRERQAKARR